MRNGGCRVHNDVIGASYQVVFQGSFFSPRHWRLLQDHITISLCYAMYVEEDNCGLGLRLTNNVSTYTFLASKTRLI